LKSNLSFRISSAVLIAVFLAVSAGAFQVEKFKSSGSKKLLDVVKGEVIVKFRSSTPGASRMNSAGRISAFTKNELKRAGVDVIKLPGTMSVESAVNYYKSLPEVEYAEPNYIRRALVIPNDTYYNSYQWGLSKIDCIDAWDIVKASWNITVAVIDTGVDYRHPDLSQNVDWLNGYNFIYPGMPPMDNNGHGTHVAGIISAMTNNGTGIAGVSWGARILPVKILDEYGMGSTESISEGVPYAVENGAKIINLSVGGEELSLTEKTVINDAYDRGAIIVAAAGNFASDNDNSNDYVMFPAALDTVIAVGAATYNGSRANFSNFGTELDFLAPGVGIWSVVPSSNPGGILNDDDDLWSPIGYASSDGTSMAAPFVSGVIALMLTKEPLLTFSEIYEKLAVTATDISPAGRDRFAGYGIVNAAKALGYRVPVLSASFNVLSTPNPFSPYKSQMVRIYFSQEIQGTVGSLKIYNIAGERVRTLSSIYANRAEWDGRNDDGDIASDGMYYYVIESSMGKIRGKITLIK